MPEAWKRAMEKARAGEVAFLDHSWQGGRVLKVLCADRKRLLEWGRQHGLSPRHIHDSRLPHFDLRGGLRLKILAELDDR